MTTTAPESDVPRRPAVRVDAPGSTYPGLRPGREVLRAGTVIDEGRPLRSDIVVDRDVAVPLRDGTTIYLDLFTPPGNPGDLPVIVVWSPYGKQDHSSLLDKIPGRMGIAKDQMSNLQKFEGPDPDDWCAQGYAIANVDPRGVNSSEGDVVFWSTEEGSDAADVIEWLAAQPWCSGKVGMSGNSWLAISQWFAAAEKPPHLAAIAPWEGMDDYYRNMAVRGGIPTGDAFVEFVLSTAVRGGGFVDDVPAVIVANPLWNDYWASKAAEIERITVPAYVVASWTQLHSSGTLDAFRRLRSQKWLRVHNTHEWPDYYDPAKVADLQRFFDHFLRGVDNGWESTPRVRLSVLDPGGVDEVDRPEEQWPPARTEHHRLFLQADGSLTAAPAEQETTVTYPATEGRVVFTHTFDADTDVIGYSALRLWVEAQGTDDMDLFVRVDKLGPDGEVRSPLVGGMPVQATSGQLRVSHRGLDPQRSTPAEPFLTHLTEELLAPGEVVPVEIGLWATSVRFRAGESLAVTVAGDRVIPAELGLPSTIPLRNRGTHVLHLGGARDASLLLPTVTPPGLDRS